jgi:hypothetical protein
LIIQFVFAISFKIFEEIFTAPENSRANCSKRSPKPLSQGGGKAHPAKILKSFSGNMAARYPVRIACESFHKARLPHPPQVDIFPREQPRG